MTLCRKVQHFIEQGQDAQAEALAQQMLREMPDQPMALVMMGHVLRVQKRHAELVEIGRPLMAQYPASADAMLVEGFANALYHVGAVQEAIGYYQHVLQKVGDPAWQANIHAGLGGAYDALGDFDASTQHYDAALHLAPGHASAQFARAMLDVKRSNLTQGLKGYRKRALISDERERFGYPCPRWQGENLDGKRLVIWTEQGVGDVAMFCGVLPWLLPKLAHLTIESVPSMSAMLARSFPKAEVIPVSSFQASEQVRNGVFDYCAPMGDLLELAEHYSPRDVRGYLKPDAARVAELRARYAPHGEKLVGISWSTINSDSAFRRNIALMQWEPILRVPGVRFVSLQYSDEQAELAKVKQALGMDILLDENLEPVKNRGDYFNQVAAMDAVVSIQNSTVHAGGAMGIPTAIMLACAGDFRWGVSGEQSRLYESVHIIRQREYGDWTPVIESAAKWLMEQI